MYNAMLKRTEVKIDGTSFFVAPFPVFAAVRITAMLSKVLAPVLGGLIALLGESADEAQRRRKTGAGGTRGERDDHAVLPASPWQCPVSGL